MGSRKESCLITEAGLRLKESGKMVRAIKEEKKLVRSRRRLQTLVASSDGKGKEEKQTPALSKLGLIKATRLSKAKRDTDSLSQGPMPTFCACLAVGHNLQEINSGKLGYRILDLGSLHPPPGGGLYLFPLL